MTRLKLSSSRPGLLVSVRSAAEAEAALAGGADVIDVKEPRQGSLGAADNRTISEVVREVAGRAVVSTALGELLDLFESQNGMPNPVAGITLFKVGLADCSASADWQSVWMQALTNFVRASNNAAQPVAVAYADWSIAKAPSPQDVLRAAIEFSCPTLLVDTWDKSRGTLFDHWPANDLQAFVTEVQSHQIAVVLAGSLTGQSIVAAARLTPDLVAVRTAACNGGRVGTVSEQRVRELKNLIAAAAKNTSDV